MVIAQIEKGGKKSLNFFRFLSEFIVVPFF